MAEAADVFVELLVGAVKKETHSAATRSGVVDHLGHQRLVGAEIQLIADTYLAGGIHNYIPQPHFLVQFTLQEHGDFGTGFFLFAIEQSGEYLGIVGHHHVASIQIVE